MAKIEVTVYWTKDTDTTQHSRRCHFEVNTPIDHVTTDIEDLILSIPLPPDYVHSASSLQVHSCKLPAAYATTPSDLDLLSAAKALLTVQYVAEAEALTAEKKEQDAQNAKVLAEIKQVLATNDPLCDQKSACYSLSPYNSGCTTLYISNDANSAHKAGAIPDDVYDAFAQKIATLNKVAKEAYDKEQEEYAKQEKEQRDLLEATKKEWIERHGSEALRLQAEMGYATDTLFFEEKLRADFAPRWATTECLSGDEQSNPPLWALKLEKDIRARLEKLGLSQETNICFDIDKSEWSIRVGAYSPLPELVDTDVIFIHLYKEDSK